MIPSVPQAQPVQRATDSRVVASRLSFAISEPSELVFQVVASRTAGHVDEAHLDVLVDGGPPESLAEIDGIHGSSMQIVHAGTGVLSVSYWARISVGIGSSVGTSHPTGIDAAELAMAEYSRQVYLRPSRYCPSDHLVGFAVAQFGVGHDVRARVRTITQWIRDRVGYVPGSSTVHDSAEDTLLRGVGTCRDFAHLGIALCRATGIPARFAAVYAPGLAPMEFHAVFETYEQGRWCVHDPTGLAPRQSLVRIATGRDAADTAFGAVISGIADLELIEVTAIAEPSLPIDDADEVLELA